MFQLMHSSYMSCHVTSLCPTVAAMFVQSSRVAVHGILAVVAGNLAGVLMGFDKSFLSCGLFGYNSFLVGLALATFYSPEKHGDYYWPVVIGSIIFAYFSRQVYMKVVCPMQFCVS